MWSILTNIYFYTVLLNSVNAKVSLETSRQQFPPRDRAGLMDEQNKQYESERGNIGESNDCKPALSCTVSKYRTADGSCNNLQYPRWGKAGECLLRLAKPMYADGHRSPKVAKSGNPLPNARLISTMIHSQKKPYYSHGSHMAMQYGQFIVHETSFTPSAQIVGGPVDCCKDENKTDECFPIAISKKDPFYSKFHRQCISFVRAAPCLTCTNQRLQINVISAFIDGSVVYGSSENVTNSLRRLDGTGMLRTQKQSDGCELLPKSLNPNKDFCSNTSINKICFAAGDVRVNALPSLMSIHTIFHREHNRICAFLSKINPHWTGETLFQEARRIVAAELQFITYNEFLPLVLGPEYMKKYGLTCNFGRTIYNPSINPSIISEFSTAAFRFGHSLIDGMFMSVTVDDKKIPYLLRDNFFNPFPFYNGELSNIVRGLVCSPSQNLDKFVSDDVRNHLYKSRSDKFGADLPAFNIQRGRDHALPGYTYFVNYCHKVRITEFKQLGQFMHKEQWLGFKSLYECVDDIDLFSGLISEFQLPDAIAGPTLACILSIQFHNLKYGDRFWFEHSGQIGSFTDAQVSQIKSTTFACIICMNVEKMPTIQARVLEKDNAKNPPLPCKKLLNECRLDYAAWRE